MDSRDIDEAKARNDLREIAGRYGLKINRSGFCRCPFHPGDNTPSLKLYPNQSFYCFGCGAHGDVIDFVSRMDGIPFREAVRSLVGHELTYQSAKSRANQIVRRDNAAKKAKEGADAVDYANGKALFYAKQMEEYEPFSDEWTENMTKKLTWERRAEMLADKEYTLKARNKEP